MSKIPFRAIDWSQIAANQQKGETGASPTTIDPIQKFPLEDR
jgi:hypothetical protein